MSNMFADTSWQSAQQVSNTYANVYVMLQNIMLCPQAMC